MIQQGGVHGQFTHFIVNMDSKQLNIINCNQALIIPQLKNYILSVVYFCYFAHYYTLAHQCSCEVKKGVR